MSFRFVGAALSILTTGASGYYVTQGTPGQAPAMVVPVTRAAPVTMAPPVAMATPGAEVRCTAAAMTPAPARTSHPASHHHAAAPTPAAATRAQPAASGDWHIHLASYHSASRADQGWTQLSQAQPTVLGALSPAKATIAIKGKGSFVRLLAGPFADKAAADQACAALAKANLYCHPLAPGHEGL